MCNIFGLNLGVAWDTNNPVVYFNIFDQSERRTTNRLHSVSNCSGSYLLFSRVDGCCWRCRNTMSAHITVLDDTNQSGFSGVVPRCPGRYWTFHPPAADMRRRDSHDPLVPSSPGSSLLLPKCDQINLSIPSQAGESHHDRWTLKLRRLGSVAYNTSLLTLHDTPGEARSRPAGAPDSCG